MVELMADVGVKLSLIFMYYNPRFFLYVPFNVKDENGKDVEKKLVVLGEPINSDIGVGFAMRDSEEGSITYLGGPLDTIEYFFARDLVDWEHLDERLEIAVRTIASMKLHHSNRIDSSMGEGFSEEAMIIQKRLEEEMLKREDSHEHEVREDFLMKRVDVDITTYETPKLTLVKEDDDEQ